MDKLVLFDVATQKRTEQAPGLDAGWQSWSRDGKYVYFFANAGSDRGIFRVAVGDNRPEKILSLQNFRATGRFGGWYSLTPNDDPLMLRDVSTQEIYALEWEAPKRRDQRRLPERLHLWKDADPDIPILKEAKGEYAKLQ